MSSSDKRIKSISTKSINKNVVYILFHLFFAVLSFFI